MNLSIYIEQLLQKHNCVIVPDFGGFIANHKSATIDVNKDRLNPPTKSILFNPNLINNDGLLGNAIAENKEIEYPQAIQFIADKVSDWKLDLENGKRIEVGEIGFLFKQKGQIVFEQSREVNILLSAYGLSSISFVNFSVKETEVEEKEAVVASKEKTIQNEGVVIELNPTIPVEKSDEQTDETVIPIQPPRKNRAALKYLAVAAVIPLLFYSYWIPVETDFIDTGKIQMADFNPIEKTPDRIYQLRQGDFEVEELPAIVSWEDLTGNLSDNVTVYNYQFSNELYIPIRLDKTATDLPLEFATGNEPNSSNKKLIYHMIGGCFSVKENANQLVSDLFDKGYTDAHILDFNNGLYRVSAGDYSSKKKALLKLEGLENNGFIGWILKK